MGAVRIPFPTGRKTKVPGYPLEAKPCRCGDQRMFDGFTCTRCGYHLLAQIRETWAAAAMRMSRSAQPEKLPARGLKRAAT